jgi:hypothetical protein
MENQSVGQNLMSIKYKGSQGQTETVVVVQEGEVYLLFYKQPISVSMETTTAPEACLTKKIILIIILMLSGSKSFRAGLAVTSRLVSNIELTVAATLKKKTRKETDLKFYKIMAVPVLLYGRETRTLRERETGT